MDLTGIVARNDGLATGSRVPPVAVLRSTGAGAAADNKQQKNRLIE